MSRILLKCMSLGMWLGWAIAVPAVLAKNHEPVIYTVQGENRMALLRVLTQANRCPFVKWDGGKSRRMALRIGKDTVPARTDASQPQSKASVFDVRVCEEAWPVDAKRAKVGDVDLSAPNTAIQRVVIIADTGCRMKASENAFQPCNDTDKWPFATIARSAAQTKPDLVIHLGDIHYRESPCPEGNKACEGSPWGYGTDTWRADFFNPALPLLEAAPWLFVRGNHESCQRAGQGWFRYIDWHKWTPDRSCDDPAKDNEADFTDPYAFSLANDLQLIIFDSSQTSGKALNSLKPAYAKYFAQTRQVEQLAGKVTSNIFLSHHPVLAFAPEKNPGSAKPGGNVGLQSVFGIRHPDRLFGKRISLAMHGHIHLFEALSFSTDHPGTFVLGNGGSAKEGLAPSSPHSDLVSLFSGVTIDEYLGHSDFGFATLDRVDSLPGEKAGQWRLTEYSTKGEVIFQCSTLSRKIHCEDARNPIR